jgi:parvulin-like peptidyl-prolyl isomerase
MADRKLTKEEMRQFAEAMKILKANRPADKSSDEPRDAALMKQVAEQAARQMQKLQELQERLQREKERRAMFDPETFRKGRSTGMLSDRERGRF